ncbi:hypothetical protein TVAG_462630 [Trichomonas vaginalis G3]|uniref:Uncharacterized protein n=1 Tax=Trichomonas vaginalis (strain ATCC PRA-98 / G3) TaxID=412133 RepID=A2DLX4_TRIV3|nr:pectin lyase-like family [Trichomonas vaginalis G3]EAY18577.1 hypothetical protein TVAG_462630 [Trichomonas vaginalis G3]KAI5491605.1 pectin lyase-like family [Trichomonas vaginalis G3]|eukprot:XP_001579563.1 hypothetical protein [Trichomonas vaginalis G3]
MIYVFSLILNSQTYKAETQPDRGKPVTFKSEEFNPQLALIQNTIFLNLSHNGQGAAIAFYHEKCNACISSCFFEKCKSMLNGGAIYAHVSNISISNSYFSDCLVPKQGYGGQAFYLSARRQNLNFTTITNCPAKVELEGTESCVSINGVQQFLSFNSSFNHPSQYAAGILTLESAYFAMKYSNFINNTSPNQILSFLNMQPDNLITFINILKNEVTVDALFYISSSIIVLENLIIFQNKGSLICQNIIFEPVIIKFLNSFTDFSNIPINYPGLKTKCSLLPTINIRTYRIPLNVSKLSAGKRKYFLTVY